MEEKEGKINLPIPHDHPHILGQCVLANDSFNFFGGIVTENSVLEQQSELNTDIHNGIIYSFSILSPDKIYKTTLNPKYTEIIGASTVFNKEINMSFTFGGLSLSNEFELLTSSDIYACRWINTTLDEKDQKIYFDPTSNYIPKKQLVDKLRCPVDSAYNYEECSNVLNLHVRNHIYTPELTTQKPSPRCFHSAAWDTINNLMWIFGGSSISQKGQKVYLNDLWVWSLYTGMWEQIEAKNPPTPRIGSSMTYLNGRLYLFGGCTSTDDLLPLESRSKSNKSIHRTFEDSDEYEKLSSDSDNFDSRPTQKEYFFYYLDISRGDFTDLTWIPIDNIPSDLQHKLYGSVIVPYSPSIFQSYIIFTGGSLTNIYDSISSLVETDRSSSKHDRMTVSAFCTQTQQFVVFPDSLSVPDVSYHSAAVSRNGTLFIAGGITTRDGYDDLTFSRCMRSFDLKKFLSFTSHVSSTFDRTILFDVSEIETDESSQGCRISSELYTDFICAVRDEIEATSSGERVQHLYNDFVRHQTQHANVQDFVVACGGVFASVQVMECRVGRPFLPSARIGARLTKDLVTYAYTGVIEMAREQSDYEFSELRALVSFCRQRGLHRLIVLEFAANIHAMSASDFIEICIDTSGGFDGKPLFADDSMSAVKTVFSRVVPLFHNLVDFSKIGELQPQTARELLAFVSGRSQKCCTFDIPRSTLESELRFFDGSAVVETANGAALCDTSSLSFDDFDLSRAKFEVVRAVTTSSFGRLFESGDADDIFSAFWLITRHKGELDRTSLSNLLGDSASKFLSFARGSQEFKRRLAGLVPQVRHLAVLEFALNLIGAGGQSEFVADDGVRFPYDCEIGPQIPHGEVRVAVGSRPLSAYLAVLYNADRVTDRSSVSSLIPPIFKCGELADDFLSLVASNFAASPCAVRKAVCDFIVCELFEDADEVKFLLLFPRLFDAELHEAALAKIAQRASARSSPARRRGGGSRSKQKTFNVSNLAQLAADDQSYMDSLSHEQMNWLIEVADRTASRTENSENFYDSEDEDDDDEKEIPFLSK